METKQQQQNKGGRPELGTQKRSNKITAAFTDKEFEALKNKAEKAGVSLAYFVYESAKNGTVTSRFTDEEKAIRTDFIKFANNINTIAKNLNYFQNNYALNGVNSSLFSLNKILNRIDKILK